MSKAVVELMGSQEIATWIGTHASNFRIGGAPYTRPVFIEVEERGNPLNRKRFDLSRSGLRSALAWMRTQTGKASALPECVMCAQDFNGELSRISAGQRMPG